MRRAICREAAAMRRAFTLVELLVVIAIIGILVALLLPAIQAAREAARRASCQNNLKNVSLAVLNYESSKKTFPMGTVFQNLGSDGIVPSIQSNFEFGESWAVSILPFMENQQLYDAFIFEDPTTKAPVRMRDNRNLEERGADLTEMLCPSDSFNRMMKYTGHGGGWARGNYAANVGTGALYSGSQNSQSALYITGPDSAGWKHYLSRGVMGPNAAVELKQITDGTSKTFMLVEIRAGIFEAIRAGRGHLATPVEIWLRFTGGAAMGTAPIFAARTLTTSPVRALRARIPKSRRSA
jgi:prepilin-type N-terminal cleavage/methylation domain-containing protein